ncbi:hypothetical protein [Phreatobacter stygius]|uniref:DUF883 family protein n=1 Tax=Phreatobacter stygius TaxID=1940610 RepID=A0A4D7BAH6_9HYPH|nr:hypothetical protein [Phreatobacter stygius]QCI67785.1 hypothetical protein E8M01_28310 [Phreatobacter stygius]
MANPVSSGKRLSAVSAAAEDAAERVSATATKAREEASELQDTVVRNAEELAANVNQKLKAAGVDTDVMVKAAKGQASELQRLVADELKARPLRALGIAAAIGLVVGFMTAR